MKCFKPMRSRLLKVYSAHSVSIVDPHSCALIYVGKKQKAPDWECQGH